MQFNLADLFEKVADTIGEREALVCGENRVTYTEFDRRTNRLAHYLLSQGVGAGDYVGLYLYNCNEYVEAMFACFKIRAVPININYRYVSDELLYVFNNADIVACIHHRVFITKLGEICDSIDQQCFFVCVDDNSNEPLNSIGSIDYEKALQAQSDHRDFDECLETDKFILYTGGTTGRPKGVIWSHKNIFFAAMGAGGFFSSNGPCVYPIDIQSRISNDQLIGIALAPLMHGASCWYACVQLLAGNKLVLNPDQSFIGEDIWDLCERESCNSIQLVGDAMAIPLIDALNDNPDRWDLTAIFTIGSGGAVFSQSKQDAFKQHFPNTFVTNSFGSSESGYLGGDSGQKKSESGLGNMAASEYMAVIVNEAGNTPRIALPRESGILARSGYIPLGYYKEPEKTAQTFISINSNTWLLTGDAAYVENDNSITIFGRGSNCINSGGEKIFPEEVEQALKANPDIFDALVIGVPDDRWGNKVVAVISCRKDIKLTLKDVQSHIRKYVADFKIPRELHVLKEIPRAPSGKPDYQLAKNRVLSKKFLIGAE